MNGGDIMSKRLYKSKKNRVIGGVCGGVGEYFNVDPVVIRILWLIALFALGTGFLVYIICLIVIPEEPDIKDVVDVDSHEQ